MTPQSSIIESLKQEAIRQLDYILEHSEYRKRGHFVYKNPNPKNIYYATKRYCEILDELESFGQDLSFTVSYLINKTSATDQ